MKYRNFIRLGIRKYTVKEWKRFDLFKQEILCKKFDIILTDHMTRKEKVKAQRKKLIKKITIKNIQKGIRTVSNGINSFSREMDNFKLYDGPKKDYSVLMGKKPSSFRLKWYHEPS